MPSLHFYSLAPYLSGDLGHDFVYHKSIEKALSSIPEIQFSCFASKNCTLTLPPHWQYYFEGSSNRLKRTFLRFRDFSHAFLSKTDSPRLFFLSEFNKHDLTALFFAATLFAKKSDILFLLFRKEPPAHSPFILQLNILRKKLPNRLFFLTDSDLTASHYEKRLHAPCHLLPIPHTHFSATLQPPRLKTNCLWPGSPRPEKGLHVIQQLLSLNDSSMEKIELTLSEQAHLPMKESPLCIRRIEKVLTKERYVEELNAADFFLLPYDPHIYRCGTSGIFVEAICLGKIPLVKEGSWLASELKKHHLPELIVDWTNPHFFTHLLQLKENRKVLGKLKKMKEAYAQFHTQENFAKKLQALIGDDCNAGFA